MRRMGNLAGAVTSRRVMDGAESFAAAVAVARRAETRHLYPAMDIDADSAVLHRGRRAGHQRHRYRCRPVVNAGMDRSRLGMRVFFLHHLLFATVQTSRQKTGAT